MLPVPQSVLEYSRFSNGFDWPQLVNTHSSCCAGWWQLKQGGPSVKSAEPATCLWQLQKQGQHTAAHTEGVADSSLNKFHTQKQAERSQHEGSRPD
jgi:hypothetical protein